MGPEILAADVISVPVKVETEHDIPSDMEHVKLTKGQDLKEPVKFGLVDVTQGVNGHGKEKADHIKNVNFPNNAADVWPEPKQIYTFYFVKYQSYEDSKLKAKFEQVNKEIQKWSKERFQKTEALKEERTERSHIISQLKHLTAEDKKYRKIIDGKRKEMEPLQAALGKLRGVNKSESMGICSSEEELDTLIKSLHYRIQHESNTLAEEKQLLKDIKQLEGTRQKVIGNAAMRAKLQDSFGPKEAIQDQVKLLGVDLDGVRKDQLAVRAKIRNLEGQLKSIDNKISSLQEELITVNQRKEKAYEALNELRKTRDEVNTSYYQNRALLNNARELAAMKDIAALKELSHDEVEKFISQWSSNKVFRDDYERRILASLDRRQLSRDGTMRNPDEKPIISETVTSVGSEETLIAKGNANPPNASVDAPQESGRNTNANEEAPAQHLSSQKVPKEGGKKLDETETKEKIAPEETESQPSSERTESQAIPEVIDTAKLKERKREEEITKAKLALERKKKLAQKAAAKAAAWAQKEAERKSKERERRAKKKAGSMMPDTAGVPTDLDTKTEEAQEVEEAKGALMPSEVKDQKENVRHRTWSKGRDQVLKLILGKKKSRWHWLWAAFAVLPALVFVIIGYLYYFGRN